MLKINKKLKNKANQKVKQKTKEEQKFKCLNCGKMVFYSPLIGTAHRNHCPFCLWSKHVDLKTGDRKAKCQDLMKPLALTFKQEGINKYKEKRQGELMLIHQCLKCQKISINRLAGDDDEKKILQILEESQNLPSQKIKELKEKGIEIITIKQKPEVLNQLFGKNL
ncbi:MAG TPA: RNHCP domain-containing protein [Candidatus Paceibacterota bacterium]|jgi:DNA-directed RNA polymerase subunit RPC12/RpoP|nr:RNHCP domain-containing protein [Candidatus Paceibacterota bacterium]HPC37569.1 RNHCP domain-containing protein [Candidatus Paceibacterota bacterium]HRU35763.1 RNHCP domain-containing protein [Candidatus Paceibacterota bacterium]